jgi:hypothetical protein
VTSSLEKIENQMQSFWDKLNGMEMQKKKCFSQDSADQQSEASARARVKRSIKRGSSEEDDTFNHKKINSERDVKSKKIIKVSKEVDEPGKAQTQRQMNASRPERTEKVESGIHMTDLGDDDTTTSETIASETEITAESPEEESVKPPPKPLPAPRKRSSLRCRVLSNIKFPTLTDYILVLAKRILLIMLLMKSFYNISRLKSRG